jgi:Ca-activated chloride channel family protein
VKTRLWRIGIVIGVLASLVFIGRNVSDSVNDDSVTLRVLSGSENRAVEPLIQAFADDQDVTIDFTYMGSIDIMRELNRGVESSYDAVWPANRMWIQLGDDSGAVQFAASIFRSPVVLGVKRSVAEQLAWIGADVSVDDVLTAAESGQLNFVMANAAQSDAGASAYLGFLYAFAGHPDMLDSAHLGSQDVEEKITRILSQVNRTSGSSAFLTELLINEYDTYDAMFNYESALIEANQALVAAGKEPLYTIYLTDGTAIADAPLAYIDKDDAEKEALFRSVQDYLLSDGAQQQLLDLGRRAGLGINPNPAMVDLSVFNPDWGLDTQRILTPITVPNAATVREALNLYQSAFRRPSFTIMLLDYSGSMAKNGGEEQMKAAMRMLLDQETAAQYLLQASPDDVTVVLAFSDRILGEWTVVGNDAGELGNLAHTIESRKADGGTAIYDAVLRGLAILHERGYADASPSIVLLTDGESNEGKGFDAMKDAIAANGWFVVPIYGIRFGSASREQLDRLAEFSSGAVFDGRDDLAAAFRAVKGYT